MSRHLQVKAVKRTPHYWIILPAQIPSACRVCIVELAWAAFILYHQPTKAFPESLCQDLCVQGSPL